MIANWAAQTCLLGRGWAMPDLKVPKHYYSTVLRRTKNFELRILLNSPVVLECWLMRRNILPKEINF